MKEKTKRTMNETEKKIDDERKTVIGKRQALEQEGRMAQERIGNLAKNDPNADGLQSSRNRTGPGRNF